MKATALFACVLPLACVACSDPVVGTPAEAPKAQADSLIPYEAYTLDNGLDIILHVDRSDPVVAINLAAHVGSARETPGRTGFAHLFEHLLFLDSENLGYGGLDEMNTRIGGEGTNGFTTNDMTQYFQAVPSDALEKVIWAEADKLGWFIQTVSQNVVDNEKQVVKNEKRQRVDNRPYGHSFQIIGETLYPSDHPYSWTVIGSLEDLDAATLQDTRDFFARWYVPNNVTLTLTGDFDVDEAKSLIEKYFGEIPAGEPVTDLPVRHATLGATTDLAYADNFATLPRLYMVWPGVEATHPDAPALDILASYLAEGKRAPLNAVLIDEAQLTSEITAFNFTKELAGEFYVILDANEGEDIDALIPALDTAFARFEADGADLSDLDRIKAGLEVAVYDEIDSALGKSIALGEANTLTGDPGNLDTRIARIRAVTPDDLTRVYNDYLKDQPHLRLSVVPDGEPDLALAGSDMLAIAEEAIVPGEGVAPDFDPAARTIDTPTPSAFDRSIEPPFGDPYALTAPEVVRTTLDNGLEVVAIPSAEVPLIAFSLRLPAGRERASPDAPAVPTLLADVLDKGTQSRTTAELEDAVKSLGSEIEVTARLDGLYVTGKSLSRNFAETMSLVTEILTEPRWDLEEFETAKRARLQEIVSNQGDPNAIAARELAALSYPADNIRHYTALGDVDAMTGITLDDLKAFYARTSTPTGSQFRIAGDVDGPAVEAALSDLTATWQGDALPPVKPGSMTPVQTAKVYFYDVPGAKQSVIRMIRPSIARTDSDYPVLDAINFPLGGIYTSDLNTQLRVEKGYTYGIRSRFTGEADRGTFGVSTSVRSNVTADSLALIREILADYGPEFTDEELATLKDALIRGQALETESLTDKLRLASEIAAYDLPADTRARDMARVTALDMDTFKALAAREINPDRMLTLIVGDAQTQLQPVRALGLPVEVLNP